MARRSKDTGKKKDNNRNHRIRPDGDYFNKNGRYKKGSFWSRKMHKDIQYRSSYEYAFYQAMERTDMVVQYIVEPFSIAYIKCTGERSQYIPDCLVLYSNGDMELCEIKPSRYVNAPNVVRKARAAIAFLKQHSKNIEYRFITEKDLFEVSKDYKDLLQELNRCRSSTHRAKKNSRG